MKVYQWEVGFAVCDNKAFARALILARCGDTKEIRDELFGSEPIVHDLPWAAINWRSSPGPANGSETAKMTVKHETRCIFNNPEFVGKLTQTKDAWVSQLIGKFELQQMTVDKLRDLINMAYSEGAVAAVDLYRELSTTQTGTEP